jgi:hypothetical protein
MMLTETDAGRFAAGCALSDLEPYEAELDDDFVRAEFDAIIAAVWPPQEPLPAPPTCPVAPVPPAPVTGFSVPSWDPIQAVLPRLRPDIRRRVRSPPRHAVFF